MMAPTPSPAPKTLFSEVVSVNTNPYRYFANHPPRAVSHIFRYGAVNRMIYKVVSADIQRGRGLWQNPWEDLTGDYSKGLKILDSILRVTHDIGMLTPGW